MAFPLSCNKFGTNTVYKLIILGLSTYVIFLSSLIHNSNSNSNSNSKLFYPGPAQTEWSRTNLSHVLFGLLGSEKAWHYRKHYIESWWRPKETLGALYLDKAPTRDLLPWSRASPPYRVSDDLTRFLQETKAEAPVMIRMVHGIMEVMRDMGDEYDEKLRWVVMGDDDSIFLVENMIDVLGSLDHRKYYYLGGRSEFLMSGYWFSFEQGFGGAGFMLSYPLARALAADMESCLRRYAALTSADTITMACIADIGVNLSPLNGLHQIDLHGDISGFLSSHPKSPFLSLHHLDAVEPLFPGMDRYESSRHLMKAAGMDQSRMLQQTICHRRKTKWSLSISWGYSVLIYEQIMPRSHLHKPLETFEPWSNTPRHRPLYMLNTRLRSNHSCHAPHVFFLNTSIVSKDSILTTYSRAAPRRLPPCSNNSADFISEIRVHSPPTKRVQMDRCECCDITAVEGTHAVLKLRECLINEVIA